MNENRRRPRARRGHPQVRLAAAAVLNTGFGVVQLLAGLAIGSVVVLADAAHQAVDALGLITAWAALWIAARPADQRWSFGFARADALGGFVSALLLVGSVVWIGVESVRRLIEPEAVAGAGVITIGLVAILINGIGVVLLRQRPTSLDRHPDAGHRVRGRVHTHGVGEPMSMRAARLHLITDLAGSFVVVAAGIGLALGGPAWIDPLASLGLSTTVLIVTLRLARSSIHLLLDRAPAGVGCDGVTRTLESHAAVRGVHHVHVRQLASAETSATAHVVIAPNAAVHEAQSVVDALGRLLRQRHGITHSTLQVECHDCGDLAHRPRSSPSSAGC